MSSDLENQGISMQGEKVREFIFSQSELPNFENFRGEHAPRSPLTALDTHKNLIVVWKSQGISSLLETGHLVKSLKPAIIHQCFAL